MMQVNVGARILMEEIQNHRAFHGTWYFSKSGSHPDYSEKILNSQTIDESAFEDVMALLGSEKDRAEIRTNLTVSGDSIEKALYRLLIARKHHRIANLQRLSPKTPTRSLSAPSSPTSPTLRSIVTEIPHLDLGGERFIKEERQCCSTPILQTINEPLDIPFKRNSSKIGTTTNSEKKEEKSETLIIPSGMLQEISISPRGKVSSTPVIPRRLSSHSKMKLASDTNTEIDKKTILQDSLRFLPNDLIISSRAPIDFKPTPTASPVSTPRTSPNSSPPSSRSASPSPGLRESSPSMACAGPPSTSTFSTTTPSTPPRPTSPILRPWFAAFFKRRPSLDPYKSENGSTNLHSPAKVSFLNRLRAKTTLSPHRTLSPVSSPRKFFFQSDFDSFRELDFKDSPQSITTQSQQQQQQLQTQQQQSYTPSPKLTSRIETLFQAAQISSMQYPFRKPLPPLREEIESIK